MVSLEADTRVRWTRLVTPIGDRGGVQFKDRAPSRLGARASAATFGRRAERSLLRRNIAGDQLRDDLRFEDAHQQREILGSQRGTPGYRSRWSRDGPPGGWPRDLRACFDERCGGPGYLNREKRIGHDDHLSLLAVREARPDRAGPGETVLQPVRSSLFVPPSVTGIPPRLARASPTLRSLWISFGATPCSARVGRIKNRSAQFVNVNF